MRFMSTERSPRMRLDLAPKGRVYREPMKIGELAQRAGVTTKAVRYYESVGLLDVTRLENGYRDFEERDVRLVQEISALLSFGLLALSNSPPLHAFGLTMLIGMALVWLISPCFRGAASSSSSPHETRQ